MSQSSDSMTGIILILLLAAIIGAIFISGILNDTGDKLDNRVSVGSQDVMMKLIMYDSMIAYGCSTGGWLDSGSIAGTDKYWGDWDRWKDGGTVGPGSNKLSWDDLNSSMPRKYEGLPCYGTGSTLPGTGNTVQNLPGSPISKEWRDDQEGRYSRIKFYINTSTGSPGSGSITIPSCFGHNVYDNPENIRGTAIYAQYEEGSGKMSNSIYLMTDNQGKTGFKPEEGLKNGYTPSCHEIVPGSTTSNSGFLQNGAAMNVNVILGPGITWSDPGIDKNSAGSGNYLNGGSFDKFDITFPEGTRGYIQTNTGCDEWATMGGYQQDDPPAQNMEVGPDHCDNKVHPFIVITHVPS